MISKAGGFGGTVLRDKDARISSQAHEGSWVLMPINISFYLKPAQEKKQHPRSCFLIAAAGECDKCLPAPSASAQLQRCALALWLSLSLSPLPGEEEVEEGEEEGWKQVCFQGVATKTKESAGTCE